METQKYLKEKGKFAKKFIEEIKLKKEAKE